MYWELGFLRVFLCTIVSPYFIVKSLQLRGRRQIAEPCKYCLVRMIVFFDVCFLYLFCFSQVGILVKIPYKYIHTPLSLSDDELVTQIGGESSVDLVTVAEAVHWFELPKFYSIVKRLLRQPGGVIAVWGYNDSEVSPTFDPVMKRVRETTLPFYDPKAQCLFDGYRTLPFRFESVGLGSEGEPLQLDIQRVMSFEEMVRGLRSSSAVTKAKDQGVDLLPEEVIKELESAWGGPNVIKTVTIKAFMLAGKVKV